MMWVKKGMLQLGTGDYGRLEKDWNHSTCGDCKVEAAWKYKLQEKKELTFTFNSIGLYEEFGAQRFNEDVVPQLQTVNEVIDS